jgi:hypothetical protein
MFLEPSRIALIQDPGFAANAEPTNRTATNTIKVFTGRICQFLRFNLAYLLTSLLSREGCWNNSEIKGILPSEPTTLDVCA